MGKLLIFCLPNYGVIDQFDLKNSFEYFDTGLMYSVKIIIDLNLSWDLWEHKV